MGITDSKQNCPKCPSCEIVSEKQCPSCVKTDDKKNEYIGCFSLNHDLMFAAVVTNDDRFGLEVQNKYMNISECNNAAKKHGVGSFGITNLQKNGLANCVMDRGYNIKHDESENTCFLNTSDNNYYGVSDYIARYKTI